MNSFRKHLMLPAALALGLPSAYAANVEVTWTEPDTYTDIQATNDTQRHFRRNVMAALETYFQEAGATLPADQTLLVSVSDVDLAGYVEYFHPAYPFGLRVIRDVDFPRLALDYELKAADGSTISAGQDILKDLGFRFPTFSTRYAQPLGYEKRLIDRWYRDTF